MKIKFLFFFVSLAFIFSLLTIYYSKENFKQICVNLIKFNSEEINLNEVGNSIQLSIINEIDMLEKDLDNFVRIGKFSAITSTINNNCDNYLENINKSVLIFEKKIKENYQKEINFLISTKIINLNLSHLFIFIIYVFYFSLFTFLFYFSVIFLFKKNFK